MILKTRRAGNHELRFSDNDTIPPPPYIGYQSAAGQRVTNTRAVGLTALGAAIRLVSGMIASLPIRVYEGQLGAKQEVERPIAGLLRQPVVGMSDYDWRYDVATSLEVCENAYLLKPKDSRGRVQELLPIPPSYVQGRLDSGEKLFTVRDVTGRTVTFTTDDVLHIRGQTVEGGPFGVSRIRQHRDPIGSMLAAQEFEGGYFKNRARPDVAFIFPQEIKREQAEQWKDEINAMYGGPENAGRPTVMGGGVQITTIPVSMADAQFVESKKLGIEEIGRIMDVEPAFLGFAQIEQQDVNSETRFLNYQFMPRLKRIERALLADPDLFPLSSPAYPEFLMDPLAFASPLTRSEVRHQQLQDGSLLIDEARAADGRPPLPDGLGARPQLAAPVGGQAIEADDG